MVDVNKVSENIHYQLIPQKENEQEGWDVRLLEGPHPETVIRYGTVSIDGKDDQMRWNMEIVSTPDENLTTESLTLQEYCGNILLDILETSIAEGSAVFRDQENQEIGLNKESFNDDEVIDVHGEYIPTEDDST